MMTRIGKENIRNHDRKLRESKMKMKRVLALILTLTLFLSGTGSFDKVAQAENDGLVVFMQESVDQEVKAGEVKKVTLPIRSHNTMIKDPVFKIVDTNNNSPFKITKPVITSENNLSVNYLTNGSTVFVDFDIIVSEMAEIGRYSLALEVSGTSVLGDEEITASLNFMVKVVEEKSPTQLTIRNVSYKNAMPGNDTVLSFTVKNEGEIAARNIYLNVNYGETGIINRYTATKVKVGDLAGGEEKAMSLPISILPAATAGQKLLAVEFEYKNMDVKGTLTSQYNIYMDVNVNEDAPNLDLEGISYPQGLKPGDKFILKATLRNFGSAKSVSTVVSVDEADSASFIKDYLTDGIKTSDIKADGSVKIEIPVIVSNNATGDLNKLTLKFDYKDSRGVVYTKTKSLYIPVVVVTPDIGKENIIISNVKQSPAQPVAGGKLDIAFDFENRGTVDIEEVKISIPLTGSHFIPVDSKPYIYVEKIAAGEIKRITLSLDLSKTIPEGLNVLAVRYSYTGGQGEVEIPVLDVYNDLGSISKPKLIVSRYEANIEELKAGSVFDFTFELRNTHSSVAAKNMTVKVTSSTKAGQNDVFSVAQGSNSFFISKIGPGETVENTLQLKVKSDVATGTYYIDVVMEYEYDGIEPNPTTGEIGEVQTEELSLRISENARPVVDYVNIYSWDGEVRVGSPATMSFEFYNMGKSTLNNVTASLEGDFMLSGGEIHFLGNVVSGDRSYAEIEVIPNVEGFAQGIVRITYEDSNGDPVEYIKEFDSYVASSTPWTPDGGDGGIDVFNPEVPTAKKPILPLWAFILIQAAVVILFIPITRKIILVVYKNKLRKKEEENY